MIRVTDMLDQPISVGNYVVFTNMIYEVLGLGKAHNATGSGYVRIMLTNPSRTTRPQNKYSKDMCVLPTDVVRNKFQLQSAE